jgi:uncharacterized protein YutE (UPF0331/DUF86 family)
MEVLTKYGTLKDEKVDEVVKALVDLLQKPPESIRAKRGELE